MKDTEAAESNTGIPLTKRN